MIQIPEQSQKIIRFIYNSTQSLDNHIKNVMPKYESSRMKGVAVIAKTYIHTYIHTHILPNLGNT